VEVIEMIKNMTIRIPCRGCSRAIVETVSNNYDLSEILSRHGFTRSPDGIGFLCDHHSNQTARPGPIHEIPEDLTTDRAAHHQGAE